MAVLIISPNEEWFSSASLLKLITEKLQTSSLFPTYQREFFNVASGWQALDLSKMGALELAAVKSIAQDIVSEVVADGPTERGGDHSYKALLDRLTELQQKLDAAIRDRSNIR